MCQVIGERSGRKWEHRVKDFIFHAEEIQLGSNDITGQVRVAYKVYNQSPWPM